MTKDAWQRFDLHSPLLVDLQPEGRFAGEDFHKSGGTLGNPAREERSTFGENLIQVMTEAVAHATGEGLAGIHAPIVPWEVRQQARLTQAQIALLMGMSLSGWRKWQQGLRRVSGPTATLLRLIQKEPDVVKRALLS